MLGIIGVGELNIPVLNILGIEYTGIALLSLPFGRYRSCSVLRRRFLRSASQNTGTGMLGRAPVE